MLAFGAATAAAALAGAGVSRSANLAWYHTLRKPPGTPPSAVFGPVWTLLYGLMAVSAYRVWRRPAGPDRSRALALWGGQLAVNAAWSPLFFGLHLPRVALVDLGALLVLLAAYAQAARRVDRPAASLMAPYLAWVGYAGYLNAGIVAQNPGR
jgi:tryptophan-rich sensory protein